VPNSLNGKVKREMQEEGLGSWPGLAVVNVGGDMSIVMVCLGPKRILRDGVLSVFTGADGGK